MLNHDLEIALWELIGKNKLKSIECTLKAIEDVAQSEEKDPPNLLSKNNQTGFVFHAVSNSNEEIALLIINYFRSRDVDYLTALNDINANEQNIFHKAAKRNFLKIFEVYFDRFTESNELLLALNKLDKFGCTPLLYAAEVGNLQMVEMVLKHGGNFDIHSNENVSPFMAAVKNNHKQIVEFFLKIPQGPAKINITDSINNSSLHIACQNGYLELAHALLNAGADTTIKNLSGKTPLDITIECYQNEKDQNKKLPYEKLLSLLNTFGAFIGADLPENFALKLSDESQIFDIATKKNNIIQETTTNLLGKIQEQFRKNINHIPSEIVSKETYQEDLKTDAILYRCQNLLNKKSELTEMKYVQLNNFYKQVIQIKSLKDLLINRLNEDQFFKQVTQSKSTKALPNELTSLFSKFQQKQLCQKTDQTNLMFHEFESESDKSDADTQEIKDIVIKLQRDLIKLLGELNKHTNSTHTVDRLTLLAGTSGVMSGVAMFVGLILAGAFFFGVKDLERLKDQYPFYNNRTALKELEFQIEYQQQVEKDSLMITGITAGLALILSLAALGLNSIARKKQYSIVNMHAADFKTTLNNLYNALPSSHPNKEKIADFITYFSNKNYFFNNHLIEKVINKLEKEINPLLGDMISGINTQFQKVSNFGIYSSNYKNTKNGSQIITPINEEELSSSDGEELPLLQRGNIKSYS